MTLNIRKHHIMIMIIFIIFIFLLILLMNSNADAISETQIPVDAILSAKISGSLEDVPEYGMFDWIEFKLEPNGRLVLKGWSVFRETKTEAQRAVQKIPEIKETDNQIIVLPNSKADDRIRNAAWKRFERVPRFENYLEGANPTVHIVVNHRKVSLFGRVNSTSDAEAFASAIGKVQRVLSVENHLSIVPGTEHIQQ